MTTTTMSQSERKSLALSMTSGVLRLARPYSQIWFVAVPTTTIAILLQGTNIDYFRVVVLALTFSFIDMGLTTVNDICDRETDRASSEAQRNTRPIASGSMPVRVAWAQAALLELAGLALGWWLEPAFGLLLVGGVVYGILYSARPVRFVGRPILSQFFWVVLWPAYYFGAWLALGGSLERGLFWVVGTIVFMGIAETLAKDLRDLENDGETGKRTTPVVYGPRRTATWSAITFLIGGICYVSGAYIVAPYKPLISVAVAACLILFCAKAIPYCLSLRSEYSKDTARALHEGAIVAFNSVNLILALGLSVAFPPGGI